MLALRLAWGWYTDRLLGAHYAHATGNDSEAVDRIFDLLHVARSLRHDPTLVAQLVAMGIDALAFSTIQTIAPGLHLTSAERTDRAARRRIQQLIGDLMDESQDWTGFRMSLLAEGPWIAETRRSAAQGVWFIAPLATMDAVRFHRNLDIVLEATHLPNKPQVQSVLAKCRIEDLTKLPLPRYSRWFTSGSGDFSRSFQAHFRILAERRVTAV